MIPWQYGFLLVALLVPVSLLLTRAMIALGPRLGLMDQPGERRIHQDAIPRCGGVAVYLTALLGLGLLHIGQTYLGSPFTGVLGGRWLLHFAGASFLLFVIGLIDDRRGMSAWVKLGGQVVAAVIMFCHDPGGMGNLIGFDVPWWVDLAVHVAWMVALINAFNLIDGMDGLCAGLGLLSTLMLTGLAFGSSNPAGALVPAVMAAALLGFLRYNFHPARIFLGDTGSMQIGFFIATVGAATVGRQATVSALLLPLLVAGVPLLDVTLAVWRRAARRVAVSKPGQAGIKIFGADRDHLHHRVLGLGLSQRQAAGTIYALAGLLAVIGLIPFLGGARMMSLSIVGLTVVGLVGLRYLAPAEFLASGNGLRTIVRRPRSSRQVVLAYFLYDTAALTVAAGLAYWLVTKSLRAELSFNDGAMAVLPFVAACILCLRFARAHSRRWTRASVHDFAESQLWFGCGVGLSFAFSAMFHADFSFREAVFHLSAGLLGLILVFLPRSIGFFLQEGVIDTMHRKRRLTSKRARRTTLLYGAGDLGELFICHVRLSQAETWGSDHFIGFLDDCPELTGRRLRGFRILGGLSDLPKLVESEGVNSVLVTSSMLGPEREEELMRVAAEFRIEVRHWRPDLSPELLRAGGGGGASSAKPSSKPVGVGDVVKG